MSKREVRVAKTYSAEQKQLVFKLKEQELKDAEQNLLYVAFIGLLALIFGSY